MEEPFTSVNVLMQQSVLHLHPIKGTEVKVLKLSRVKALIR